MKLGGWMGSFVLIAACGGSSDGPPGGAGGAESGLAISGGKYHTCLRLLDGSMYCWGQGAYRQLGGDYGAQSVARRIDSFDDALTLECGYRFTCAIRPGGAVWCWGDDDHGQAGTAATEPCGDAVIDSVCIATPQPLVGIERGAVELALGDDHACARMDDGTVRCWGDNSKGQAGSNTAGDITAPHEVPEITDATEIAAGDQHTCARMGTPGTVSCWGANDSGQLGHGPAGDGVNAMPSEVDGVTDAVEIVAGGEHTCARLENGHVQCWGYDYLGQLGNGSKRPTRATQPQAVVGLDDAVELAAGRYHTCARRQTGKVMCWGDNDKGEVGDGTTMTRTVPTEVIGLDDAARIAAGAWHACAAHSDGSVVCWGDDLGGQLGDDRIEHGPTSTPVSVQALP